MSKETIDTAMLTTTRARREIYQLIDERIEETSGFDYEPRHAGSHLSSRSAGRYLKEYDLIHLAAWAIQRVEKIRKEREEGKR